MLRILRTIFVLGQALWHLPRGGRDPSSASPPQDDSGAAERSGDRSLRGGKEDLIRRFAPPVRLAVPENPVGLALILLRFFDRCGDCGSPFSATGSGDPQSCHRQREAGIPLAQGRFLAILGQMGEPRTTLRLAGDDTSSAIRLAGDRRMPPSPQVNADEIGESRLRENLRSDEGSFSQEYFVYCKKK